MQKIIQELIAEAADAINGLDEKKQAEIASAAELIIDCYRAGGALYVCGNGGSAADAQHIATELANRFLRERAALPCTALSTDTSLLTAIGNDYTFDYIFARQVEAHLRTGDVLWAITTSGTSNNVLEAAKVARKKGGKVLGFTGGNGGNLPDLCDVCFIAPAKTTYGIQQLHQVAYHIICDLVERQAETFK